MRARRSLLTFALTTLLAAGSTVAEAAEPAQITPPTPQLLEHTSSGPHDAALMRRQLSGDARVVVTYTPGAAVAARLGIRPPVGATLRQQLRNVGATSFTVAARDVTRVMAELKATPGVKTVERVGYLVPADAPNDPDYVTKQQTYLDAVHASEAWGLTHAGASSDVAIIDSGADVAHPDLAGQVDATYDVVTGTAAVPDCYGHGTFVAGVVGAATNNAVGVAGASWGAHLHIYKVDDNVACDGVAAVDDVMAAIDRAIADEVDVINVAYTGSWSEALQAALGRAHSHNITVVAAAGNRGGSPYATHASYPAADPWVIGVGATSGTTRASYSSHGPWVDVAAPGSGLWSTTPTVGSKRFDPSYDNGNGTSFAAALVSAEAALLRAARPFLSPYQTRTAIVGSASGFSGLGLGTGQVNFRAAFDRLPPPGIPAFAVPDHEGASVSGEAPVALNLHPSATWVRFYVDGSKDHREIRTSTSGAASSTVRTWGWPNGTHTWSAQQCNDFGCGVGRARRTITYANPAPTLTAPAPGVLVSQPTALTAQGSGWMGFYIDGKLVAVDTEAPYSWALNPSTLTEGSHRWHARGCYWENDGSYCNGPNSEARSFTVRTLHPVIRSVVPTVISPNGDGRADATVVSYSLPEPMQMSLRVVNAAGSTVFGPAPLGTKAAGDHTVRWAGFGPGAAKLPDATYRVILGAVKSTPEGTARAYVDARVRIDTILPVLSNVTGENNAIYPFRDHYKDSAQYRVTSSESALLTFEVYNSAGSRVANVAQYGGFAQGFWLDWYGHIGNTPLPPGTYYFQFVAQDGARNITRSPRYVTTIHRERLVAKSGVVTVTPQASRIGSAIGECSGVGTPATSSWPGSHAYLSMYRAPNCNVAAADTDLAATFHQATLPMVYDYGSVRVYAYGQSAPGRSDRAGLVYIYKDGTSSTYGASLGPAAANYSGDVHYAKYFLDGRVMRWYAGTVNGGRYWIKNFTVSFTYRVLQ